MKALIKENLLELTIILLLGFSLARLGAINKSLDRVSQIAYDLDFSIAPEYQLSSVEKPKFHSDFYCTKRKGINYRMKIDSNYSIYLERIEGKKVEVLETVYPVVKQKNNAFFISVIEDDGRQSTYWFRKVVKDSENRINSFSLGKYQASRENCQ